MWNTNFENMTQKILTLAAVLLLSFGSGIAQNTDQVKGALVYKLSTLVSGTGGAKTVIGVHGNDAMFSTLRTIAEFSGGGSVEVIKLKGDMSDVTSCSVVFVSNSSKLQLAASLTEGKSILIIADDAGSSDRLWAINLAEKAGKMGYQVDKANLGARSLTGDSQLFSLASKVY